MKKFYEGICSLLNSARTSKRGLLQLAMTCGLYNIIAILLVSSVASGTLVRVNSDHGNDSQSCLDSEGKGACKTLTYATIHLKETSNVTVLIDTNTTLNGTVLIENIAFFQINGSLPPKESSNEKREVKCLNKSGLVFKNTSEIAIFNIVLTHCGTFDIETKYEVALLFKNSSEIELLNATVTKSQLTAVAFLECSGAILLENVQLMDNGNSHRNYSFPAGVSIKMTQTDATAYYILKRCNISGNNAVNFTHWHYNVSKKLLHGSSWGGGIGVYFSGNSSGNSVEIKDSNISDNMGRWGGGIYIQFHNFSENNTVSVVKSNIHKNVALSYGGGVCIMYLNDEDLENRTNRVTFSNVDIVNNYANYGGGIVIQALYGNKVYKPGENLNFSYCLLSENKALYSPAVDAIPYFYQHSINRGFLPIPLFSNVNITQNELKVEQKESNRTWKFVIGVFSIMQFTVYFAEEIHFSKNLYSALLLSSSAQVVFEEHSVTTFSHNEGNTGAGIALYGSTLILSNHSHLNFKGNKAYQLGGGIFYKTTDQHTFITGTSCFIRYIQSNVPPEKRNVTLHFSGNIAHGGGSSIYADSFYSCLFSCSNYTETNMTDVMKCIGNVNLDKDKNSSHSPLQSSSSKFVFNSMHTEDSFIPGAKNSIPYRILDQFDTSLTPLLNVGVTNHTSRKHTKATKVFPEYLLSSNKFAVYGSPNTSATLRFTTQGIAGIYTLMKVKLLDCPPGFQFDPQNSRCKCSTDHAIQYCNYATHRAHMKKNYWAGYIPENSTHKSLYFAICFPPICSDNYTYLPNSSSKLESTVCFRKRTGIMCGNCTEGYSVYYSSRDYLCKLNHNCYFGPLLYVVTEIVPVCILFAVIVIFDFSFTSGEMVAFIFFSQYLNHLTIHVDNTFESIQRPYQVFYGLFNFASDLFPFCLWKDFQILDIIFFKYVTIVVALVLVLAVVTLLKSNCCCLWLLKWRAKVTKKTSFVRGLSAFLVICYSQCTRTSFFILKSTTPKRINATTINDYSYYGGLRYLEGRHLMYAIPAIITLVFVTILPPLLLLVYPLSLHLLSLCNLSEHWIVNKILKITAVNRLMPFMDCFQSCYKDKLRFFAGLSFVYRVVILLNYIISYDYRMTSAISLILFQGIHAVVQPYKNRIHNLLDSLIFLNLALINAISIYSSYFLGTVNGSKMDINLMLLATVQLVLLYMPMVVFLLTAAVKVYLYCKKRVGKEDYEMLEEN